MKRNKSSQNKLSCNAKAKNIERYFQETWATGFQTFLHQPARNTHDTTDSRPEWPYSKLDKSKLDNPRVTIKIESTPGGRHLLVSIPVQMQTLPYEVLHDIVHKEIEEFFQDVTRHLKFHRERLNPSLDRNARLQTYEISWWDY